MPSTLQIFSCARIKPPRRLPDALRQAFPNVDSAPLHGRFCYLDTFDWRLHEHRWVLEALAKETRLLP